MLLLLLAGGARGFTLLQQAGGATPESIAASFAQGAVTPPELALGHVWHFPLLADDARGAGRGLAYVLDDSLCDGYAGHSGLTATVRADDLFTRAFAPRVKASCADLKAAIGRGFAAWSALAPLLSFVDVTERCRQEVGATLSDCPWAEVFVTVRSANGPVRGAAPPLPFPYDGSAPASTDPCTARGRFPGAAPAACEATWSALAAAEAAASAALAGVNLSVAFDATALAEPVPSAATAAAALEPEVSLEWSRARRASILATAQVATRLADLRTASGLVATNASGFAAPRIETTYALLAFSNADADGWTWCVDRPACPDSPSALRVVLWLLLLIAVGTAVGAAWLNPTSVSGTALTTTITVSVLAFCAMAVVLLETGLLRACEDCVDVALVSTHEVGHALGLGHADNATESLGVAGDCAAGWAGVAAAPVPAASVMMAYYDAIAAGVAADDATAAALLYAPPCAAPVPAQAVRAANAALEGAGARTVVEEVLGGVLAPALLVGVCVALAGAAIAGAVALAGTEEAGSRGGGGERLLSK